MLHEFTNCLDLRHSTFLCNQLSFRIKLSSLASTYHFVTRATRYFWCSREAGKVHFVSETLASFVLAMFYHFRFFDEHFFPPLTQSVQSIECNATRMYPNKPLDKGNTKRLNTSNSSSRGGDVERRKILTIPQNLLASSHFQRFMDAKIQMKWHECLTRTIFMKAA